MAGKTQAPARAAIWGEIERFGPKSTPMRQPGVSNPLGPPKEDPLAFRPMSIRDHLDLARAPKRETPAPYLVDRGPRTHDFTGGRQAEYVQDLRYYRPGDILATPGADVRIRWNGAPAVSLKPGFENGRAAGREGPVLIPPGPDEASVKANMEEAGRHPPWWLMTKVPNGKPWDYKQEGRLFEAFGNFNFGAVGRAARLPDHVLLRGAGWAQGQAKTSRLDYGSPYLGTRSYGDDPVDQFWIVQGARYHDRKPR